MKSKLYYYVVSLTGYETYIPTTLMHTKKYSKKEFNRLLHKIIIEKIREDAHPDNPDYEVITCVVDSLINDYKFVKLKPVCEYQHGEFTFFNWLPVLVKNKQEIDKEWHCRIKRPKWIPKEIIQEIEAKVLANNV